MSASQRLAGSAGAPSRIATDRSRPKKSAGSAVVAAGTITLAKPTYAKLGKNEEIQVGVMGYNGRGKSHIQAHQPFCSTSCQVTVTPLTLGISRHVSLHESK